MRSGLLAHDSRFNWSVGLGLLNRGVILSFKLVQNIGLVSLVGVVVCVDDFVHDVCLEGSVPNRPQWSVLIITAILLAVAYDATAALNARIFRGTI